MVEIIWNLLRKARWLFKDIRSAAVASVISTFSTITVVQCSQMERNIIIDTNRDGYAQPMPILLSQIESEGHLISVDFSPPEIRKTFVCEYADISARSWDAVFFAYLNRYPMCFSLNQTSDVSYSVRPNTRSGEMLEVNNVWFCKCTN